MFKSSSIDPLSEFDIRTEHLADGSWIAHNNKGEIVKTSDALGIRRDFARESVSRQLMMRKFGVWTKLEGGGLDANGTLFYCKRDIEIQERLNGVHIHTNRHTGVQIQTDHLNHSEIMRQANGEVWKRQLDEQRETFEIWMNGKLGFRTQTFFEPQRIDAGTASGAQPLVYVCRVEQSWENGNLVREKFSFRNPIDNQREVTLTVPVSGTLTPLRKVYAVLTTFSEAAPQETVYQMSNGSCVRVDAHGARYDLTDTHQMRQFSAGVAQEQAPFGTAASGIAAL